MGDEKYINDKFTIDELIKRSWDYSNSKDFVRFFNFVAKFHHYSRYNSMLVYIQNPYVELFGGTGYWKKFKRQVRKDARPYLILAPMSPVMLVYDIKDTEGEYSPEEFMEKGLGRKPFEVKGSLNPELFHGALFLADKWRIPVYQKPLSYFNAGYVTTKRKGRLEICLKEGLEVEQNFSVLLHELAHILLGHTGFRDLVHRKEGNRLRLPQRDELNISIEELEAEAVAYLIGKKYGLEKRSAEYMAGYIDSYERLINFSYERVIKVADKIENTFLLPISSLLKKEKQ